MPRNSEKFEKAFLYLLTQIKKHNPTPVKKTSEDLGLARSTVYNYLSHLIAKGVVEKTDDGYHIVYKKHEITLLNPSAIAEDEVFDTQIEPLLRPVVNENAHHIWRYAFCEILNNAIEHSKATKVLCVVEIAPIDVIITIADDGIGIFNNIVGFIKATTGKDISVDDAISILMPGKFTTARQNHSGEGIFFTSRAVDNFVILSDGRYFRHNPFSESTFAVEIPNKNGTGVSMELSNTTGRRLADVFNHYSNPDEGFFKTVLPIGVLFSDSPVARSEARRLCSLFESFDTVELDFSNVRFVGQAFVHEIFVVYQKSHPDKTIIPINAIPEVEGMIRRVLNTV